MKLIKNIGGLGLGLALVLGASSCSDKLDLAPIDYYGSGSYWKSKAHATAAVEGLNWHMRNNYNVQVFLFGEVRAGIYKDGVNTDGMAANYGSTRLQLMRPDAVDVNNFGNLYGPIAICNQFIREINNGTMVSGAEKDYYLGIAHGLRAYYYYALYRNYGGVPLRLGTEVIDGILDPEKLGAYHAKPSEIYAQIAEDIQKSLDLFGTQTNFSSYGFLPKATWSKAATEALAADFYLWSAKVTTGDQAADPSLVARAKTHLQSLESGYNLSLQNDFARVFDVTNKANSEIILALRFQESELTNNLANWTYVVSNGYVNRGYLREDGTAWNDVLNLKTGTSQSMEYVPQLFQSYDRQDSRRDATFVGSYLNEGGSLVLKGTHVRKNIGYINAQGNRVYNGDIPIYRLPWVYLALAEVANMENDNVNVAKYINLVRKRAYGSNWGPTHEFVASDFKTNELAILSEKTKEFVQEGQRWYDLRRMTSSRGGTALVFEPEANIADPTRPVLNPADAHKVLWPINKAVIDNDKGINQTPGY